MWCGHLGVRAALAPLKAWLAIESATLPVLLTEAMLRAVIGRALPGRVLCTSLELFSGLLTVLRAVIGRALLAELHLLIDDRALPSAASARPITPVSVDSFTSLKRATMQSSFNRSSCQERGSPTCRPDSDSQGVCTSSLIKNCTQVYNKCPGKQPRDRQQQCGAQPEALLTIPWWLRCWDR